MAVITRLPLDLEGTALSNRVDGEEHTLIKVTNRTNRALVPRMGAFYEENFRLYNDKGQVLTKGKDYTLTYLYDDLSVLTGLSIYAIVVVTNPLVSSTVKIDYRALGGPNVLNVKELAAVMKTLSDGTLEFKYSDIVGRPSGFIPEEHEHYWWQVYGMESTIESLKGISEGIANRDDKIESNTVSYGDRLIAECQVLIDNFAAAAARHYSDYANPHKSDKQKIGLGFLNNWPIATDTEAKPGLRGDLYLSPSGAYQILAAGFIPAINNHANDPDNPHRLTAEQLNAYTTAVKQAKIATLLNRGATAVNSALLNGSSYQALFNDARSNIPMDNVVSGIFEPVRLGSGTASQDTLLTNAMTFKPVSTLFSQNVQTSNNAIWVGSYNTEAQILAALNASFMNLAAYPLGTVAFARVQSYSPVTTNWTAVYYVRIASGWRLFG